MKILILFIVLIFGFLGYLLFLPHTLRVSVINGVTRVWFLKTKVFDSSKVKKKPKKKQESLYVKVPTISGVKKIIKGLIDVYLKDKDDAFLILRQVIDNCHLKNCVISVNFGTGDAALTGIAYGIGWQIISFIYSKVIKNEQQRKIISIAFTADYEKALMDYKVDFTLKFKAYKHLCLLLKAFKLFKRIKAKFI